MKLLLSFVAVLVLAASAPVGTGYNVGDTVPDFKLKNVDGKMVSMADFKNAKGFIIAFDCNTCPMSKKYNDRILALDKKYASQGFPLIAINPNSPEASAGDSYDEMVKYAKDHGYTFPYLYDESQQIVKDFGATNTPHVFVVTKSGNTFKVAYIGAIDDSPSESGVTKKYVEEAVDALVAGKSVGTSKTKAVGCTIKWKNA